MKPFLFSGVASCLLIASAFAVDVPEMVKDGFDSYMRNGPAAAFEIWLKGSAMENDEAMRKGITNELTLLEKLYGKANGYEVLSTSELTSRLRRVYAVSYHSKGPIFYCLDFYQSDGKWIAYLVNFNTKPAEVLPASLLEKPAKPAVQRK